MFLKCIFAKSASYQYRYQSASGTHSFDKKYHLSFKKMSCKMSYAKTKFNFLHISSDYSIGIRVLKCLVITLYYCLTVCFDLSLS